MLLLELGVSVINAVLLCLLALRLLHVMQLGGYRLRRFIAWMFDGKAKYFLSLFVISVLGFGTAFGMQTVLGGLWGYLWLIPYAALVVTVVILNFRMKVKVPLKYTPRIWRLLTVTFILSTALSYLMAYINPQFVATVPCVLPFILVIAQLILAPFEWILRMYYRGKAKRKLFSPQYKDLIRIGITGSYGKTSCKNILATMLEQKYKVAISPASYNTPMGFCLTVNKVLQPEHQVLIMEMGARYKGDIKTMAKLVKPHHGILTSIGSAHLETFGSLENIKREKYELINALPADGFRVIGGDKPDNIEMCAELAKKLGVTDEQIKSAVEKLKPVPHRLEITKTEHGVTIIDDSYNCCTEGTLAALEKLDTLAKESGGKKIIVTPGMVELGRRGDEENFKFGLNMAGVADKIIIVNVINKKMIFDGLVAGGFDESNITCVKDLEAAKDVYAPMLKKGDVILLENDLPDNYS